jgi:hypothetical protein
MAEPKKGSEDSFEMIIFPGFRARAQSGLGIFEHILGWKVGPENYPPDFAQKCGKNHSFIGICDQLLYTF